MIYIITQLELSYGVKTGRVNRVYAFSETFPSYVPSERKMKMVYALKCPLAPDFGEITYEQEITAFIRHL